METFFGTTTLVFAVTMSLVALPLQIRKNYKDKSVGWSFFFIFLSIGIFGNRIAYSLVIDASYLIFSDSVGLLLNLIILAQYFYYRNNKKKPDA